MTAARVTLIGHPVAHSLSPAMHNAAFAAVGLPHRYDVTDVAPERLASLFAALRDPGMLGANVTVPYKEAALALVDELEPAARDVGAMNTVFRRESRLVGDNTDVQGFVMATRSGSSGSLLDGRRVLVLGAGGAARACAYALLTSSEVLIANRSPERAKRLAGQLVVGGRRAAAVPWPAVDGALAALGIEAVVNATTLGLHGEDPLQGHTLPPIVVDLVPTAAETPLVTRARRAQDVTVVDGLLMLLHQAARSFERWTGLPAPVEVMRRALPRAI